MFNPTINLPKVIWDLYLIGLKISFNYIFTVGMLLMKNRRVTGFGKTNHLYTFIVL